MQAAQGAEPISGSDAKAVADAVREMVRVHQVLLNILIGKAGLFNTVPLIGQPVAAVLRSYEAVIDASLFKLVDLTSAEFAKSITDQKNSLDVSIKAAITAYTNLELLWQ